MQRREEKHRTEMSLDLCALKTLVSRLLKAELDIWSNGQQWLERDGGLADRGVCFTMTNHFVQWSARRAKGLQEELEALSGSMEHYHALIESRQKMFPIAPFNS